MARNLLDFLQDVGIFRKNKHPTRTQYKSSIRTGSRWKQDDDDCY